MLINKEDRTVAELRGILQSHLGEKNGTELFQDLMCAKQHDHETPQQFWYRVIGMKQWVLLESKQPGTGTKYRPDSVQGVFLHTVYQGIGHRHSDFCRELKLLLSNHTVYDEAILKYVMHVTSDESERRRRLGPIQHQKHTMVHSAHVDGENVKQPNTKKEIGDLKVKTDTIQHLTENRNTNQTGGLTSTDCSERLNLPLHFSSTQSKEKQALWMSDMCAGRFTRL